MKLSSIKQTVDSAIPLIQTLTSQATGNQMLRFTGLHALKNAVTELKTLDIFENEIEIISNSPIMTKTADIGDIAAVEGRVFRENVKELINGLIFLSKSLDKVLSVDEVSRDNSVYIKLPNTHNLDELSKDIEIFNKILSLTILDPKIDGEVTLESVEPGSVWLKIYVRSTLAVSLIGSLAWSSAVVYKKIQEGKLIEEIVNQRKLENAQKQNAIDASKLLTDIMIEAEAEHLYHTYYENGEIDNEQIERIKLSIKMLSEEIYKGAEINPALTAPEEVSNLFPDMKTLPSIQSKIKKIGE